MENNLAGMFYPLSDKIGKTKADIINDFSQSNRQLLFELFEVAFNGHILISKGNLSVNMNDYNYDFKIEGDVCRSVRLNIRNEALLNESIKYCTENYPVITENTWLMESPATVAVFLFQQKAENDTIESYFQSAPSHPGI